MIDDIRQCYTSPAEETSNKSKQAGPAEGVSCSSNCAERLASQICWNNLEQVALALALLDLTDN